MISFKTLFRNNSQIIVYGFCLSVVAFLLKWLQWRFIILDNSIEIYIGLIALLFTLLGIWVAKQLTKTKIETVIVEKEIYISTPENFVVDENELAKLNLTPREWEVLQLMTKGNSNAEIAKKLFLSVSTIKTHVSNVFVKMDVKSRTQAMDKAKRLKIIQ